MTTELETRYGRGPRFSERQKYVAVTVALLLGVLAAYAVFRNSEPEVQGVGLGFQVVSDSQVTVQYEVHRPAGMAVVCTVRARDADGAQVGTAQVTVPAGPKVTRQSYTLTTTARANTGEVQDCTQAP